MGEIQRAKSETEEGNTPAACIQRKAGGREVGREGGGSTYNSRKSMRYPDMCGAWM